MLIKIILLLAILVIAWFSLRAAAGSRGRAVRTLAVLAFAVIAAISVIFPEILTAVARVVGVGRGTDLLVYGLVLLVIASLVSAQRRHKIFEVQLTRLARRQALDDAAPQLQQRIAARATHDAPGHHAISSEALPSEALPSEALPSDGIPTTPARDETMKEPRR